MALAAGLLILAACGSGDDAADPSAASESGAEESTPKSTDTGDDDGSEVDDPAGNADGEGSTDPGGSPGENDPQDDDDSSSAATSSTTPRAGSEAAAGTLSSEQICALVTATAVSEATGLDISSNDPAAADKTPQCRYNFTGADGIATNATVSVLRPAQDMEGLSGSAAFQHSLTLNRNAAAASGLEVTESELGVGDDSVLFENDLLRYGIVRYGERIVTIIFTAPSVDHAAVLALASATAPLAP